MIGVEYERGAAQRLAAVQRLPLTVADVRALPFADGTFDATLAFGVLGGLESDLGRGLAELIRVTRPGGLVVVSLMLDNLARRLQSLLGLLGNRPPRRFYAWRDTTRGWREHLGKCGLTIVEHSFMNSRYNFYYWTPLLRKTGQAFDHAQARVCDRLFPLNAVGETLFRLSTTLLPTAFAGAVLYVCRKQARGQ